ncbi:MAG: hypothetical protein JWR37_6112 [Mycobacterium sp.]|nr:hypothetical protein [Mycobacterium sp.]
MAKSGISVNTVNAAGDDTATTRQHAVWPSALREMPARMQRHYPQGLPQARTPTVNEPPLLETDASPDISVLREIDVKNGPIAGIATTADGKHLLATHYGKNSVSVIDTDTFAVVKTITGMEEPFVLAAGRDRAYVSTASAAYDAISVIDSNTHDVVATYPVALNVVDVAASADGNSLYASRTGLDVADVVVIDVTSGRATTIDVAAGPGVTAGPVCVSPDGRRLYAATTDEFGADFVAIDIAAQRVVDAVRLGFPIRDAAVSHDGASAYLLTTDGDIVVIDTVTNEIANTVEIGGSPTQLALSTDGRRMYVLDQEHVTVLCSGTYEVTDTVTVASEPSCVADSPDGRQLYVADYAGNVTMLFVAPAAASLPARMMAVDISDAPELVQPELATV